VKTKGDYLEFQDSASFYQRLEQVDNLSDSALDIWENSMGFLSMRKIYNVYDSVALNLPDTITTSTTGYSDSLYQSYVGYIKKYRGSFWVDVAYDSAFRINAFDYRMGALVNKNGIVMIGGVFYQFTREWVKVMLDSNECKVPNLIAAVTDSEVDKIYVRPVVCTPIMTYARLEGRGHCQNNGGGRHKVVGDVELFYSKVPIIERWQWDDRFINVITAWDEKSTLSATIKAERQVRHLWYVKDWEAAKYDYLRIKMGYKLTVVSTGKIEEKGLDTGTIRAGTSRSSRTKVYYSGPKINLDYARAEFITEIWVNGWVSYTVYRSCKASI
jgi:hypothetical protein